MNNKSSWLQKNAKSWFFPIASLISVTLFTIFAALAYEANEARYLTAKSAQIAEGVARSLRSEIQNRVAVARVLGKTLNTHNQKTFEELADALVSEYPGFYAINIVNLTGVISKVFPVENNRAALGQNLLNRADVKEYLLSARDNKEARMSHKLMTFQKVPAFTLYVPLFNEQKKFIGWLNAVVDFDTWLINFIKANALHHTRIVVKWNHPESDIIDRGANEVDKFFSSEHMILNQNITLKIGFSEDDMDASRAQHQALLIAVGSGLLFLALLLILRLHLSKINLFVANRNLAMKNNLLSSLSHDLSTPLTALSITLDPILQTNEAPQPQSIIKISRAIQSLKDILQASKILHAQNMGVLQIPTEAISLANSVADAVLSAQSQTERKNIQITTDPIPKDFLVCANAVTLVNNVLANVLTNAIKFSPRNGKIKIYSSATQTQVQLTVEDEGAGFQPEQLRAFKKAHIISSTKGTLGERGTGLGLMQIRGFMEAYGGRMEVSNLTTAGCRISLFFQRHQI